MFGKNMSVVCLCCTLHQTVDIKLDRGWCETAGADSNTSLSPRGFGEQAHKYPVTLSPRLPFRGESNTKTTTITKKKKLCSMRLWTGWGVTGGFQGWVWCFLPLSDDGGVFTASFYRNVCVCHVWAWQRWGSVIRLGNFKTPANRPNAGIFWQVLVLFFYFYCTLLPHCPVHQVLTGKGRAYWIYWAWSRDWSTFHYVKERRGDRQVRLRALLSFFFSQVDVPANYLWSKSWFKTRRVTLKQNDWLWLFSGNAQKRGSSPLSLCVCSHLKNTTTLETTDFLSFALPS